MNVILKDQNYIYVHQMYLVYHGWLLEFDCQQYLSHQEFKRFWFRNDSHWIKIKVIRIHNTHYTIQVYIDYTSVILNEDRKIHLHFKQKLNKNIFQLTFSLDK